MLRDSPFYTMLKLILEPKSSNQRYQQTTYKENVFRYTMLSIMLIISILTLFFDKPNREMHIRTFVLVATNYINLHIFCRSNIFTFSMIYAIATVVYSHSISSIFGSWFESQMNMLLLPAYTLMLTGNVLSMLISIVGLSFFNLHNFLTGMREAICNEDAGNQIEVFMGKFIISTVLTYFFAIYVYYEHRKSKAKTEYKFQSQNKFLLCLSHEIRNPLNSVLGNIQLALKSSGDSVHNHLQNALMAGEMLLQFINAMLDSGKMDTGMLDIKPSLTNFKSCIEKVWNIARMIIAEKGLAGSIFISKEIPENIYIDFHRLNQIFLNLIGNSTKFTQKGKITIDCSWVADEEEVKPENFEPAPFSDSEGIFEKNMCIHLGDSILGETLYLAQTKFLRSGTQQRQVSNKGILKIAFQDTGDGMSEASVKNLFKKFSQVNDDVRKRQNGTGLGLYLCKKLVEKMNGIIEVFSRENVGTVFIICLPIGEPSEETK